MFELVRKNRELCIKPMGFATASPSGAANG
jgi:hypothetical protein